MMRVRLVLCYSLVSSLKKTTGLCLSTDTDASIPVTVTRSIVAVIIIRLCPMNRLCEISSTFLHTIQLTA